VHIFEHLEFDHQQVIFFNREQSGLRGIIAIHKPFFNPIFKRPSTLGGTRMQPYESIDAAYTDVLRLSRGMTKKAALAGVDFGGAKTVIIGDPKKDKTPLLLDNFADVLNSLRGLYVVGQDMGMTKDDMDYLSKRTPWVSGKSRELGGSGSPGRFTALGVFKGLLVCMQYRYGYGASEMRGKWFAIPGLGNVGQPLAILIAKAGGNLIITDINQDAISRTVAKLEKYNIELRVVDPSEIHKKKVLAYCPCAGGAVINDGTIIELNCSIIAGSANNQLATPEHGDMLDEQGICYAPDYVINPSGLINVVGEFDPGGYDEQVSLRRISRIPERLHHIFSESDRRMIPPHRVADEMAGEITEKKVRECSEQLRKQCAKNPV